jgi:hypothetical protein
VKSRAVMTAILLLHLGLPLARAQRAENGVVTGQLRAPNGTAAVGVRVAALAVPDDGNAQGAGAMVSLAETDSAGQYRLENIPPGRYYIQAGFIAAPSYYPGVSTTAGATNIMIAAGETRAGIDFTMSRSAGVRVSGRLPLTVNVTPRPSIRLIGGSMPIAGPNAPQTIGADGYFEFNRVAPGNYTLSVLPSTSLLPNLPIIVADKDVEIGLPVGPGVKVSGVVGLGPNSPRPANQRVVLTGSSAWAQVEAKVSAGGGFEFASVPPGSYSVRTIPGSSMEVTKLAVADREIGGLVFPALVELAGRVTVDGGGAIPPSNMALMIEANRSNGTSVATAAGSDGSFRFPLSEGEYRIAVGRLPAGVSVKSLSYGPLDLLANSLKLDGTAAPLEIRLTLERK